MDYSYGLLLESLMDQPSRHRANQRFTTKTANRPRHWRTARQRWTTATPRQQLRARTT